MDVTRRTSIPLFAAVLLGLSAPARAEEETIRIGWITPLTGPSSAPGIGFDRGVRFAVDEINAGGGLRGRKVEVITRDSQGDPAKAVNAVAELTGRLGVKAIFGPVNSGESLATAPVMTRAGIPNMNPSVITGLINEEKYPTVFRVGPTQLQWEQAITRYIARTLALKQAALISDTSGFALSQADAQVKGFDRDGVHLAYRGQIDPNQPNVMPDMLRAREAKAEVLVPWSVNPAFLSRLINARGQMGWEVPIVGHSALGAGDVKGLLEKPEYWRQVFAIGFRSCSYDEAGNFPPRTRDFIARATGRINFDDSLLYWLTEGYDGIGVIAAAIRSVGTEPRDIVAFWNRSTNLPGVFADWTWSPTDHNGFPSDGVVMNTADSFKSGGFRLAPGVA